MKATFENLANMGILIDVTSDIQKKRGTRQYKKIYCIESDADITIDKYGIVHEGSNSRPNEEHMFYKVIREFCLPESKTLSPTVRTTINNKVIPVLEQNIKITSLTGSSELSKITEDLCTKVIKDPKVQNILRLRVHLIEQFGDANKFFDSSAQIFYHRSVSKYILKCLEIDKTIDYDNCIYDLLNIIDPSIVQLVISNEFRQIAELLERIIDSDSIKAFKIIENERSYYDKVVKSLSDEFSYHKLRCKSDNLINFRSIKLFDMMYTDSFPIRRVSKNLNLSNKIYTLKYICNNKSTDKKYLSLIGKWDRLPAVYEYDFHKIMELLIKTNDELKTSFDDID